MTDLSGSQSIPPGPDTRRPSTGNTTTPPPPRTHTEHSTDAKHNQHRRFEVIYFIYWSCRVRVTLPVHPVISENDTKKLFSLSAPSLPPSIIENCSISITSDRQVRWIPRSNRGRYALIGNKRPGSGHKSDFIQRRRVRDSSPSHSRGSCCHSRQSPQQASDS